ncbi:hypothetical protein SKAU_G00402190 [Synaphobranchus kaupii]|uniref:Uncharacterized protein n=1 Tax=Synaphobranchus kaupii TaxID=118154 RepID=A0A9Q1E9B0_SYNKA|nr:hypothetical protein SKAU_G00402190 [Synaphobranchus kaupii]
MSMNKDTKVVRIKRLCVSLSAVQFRSVPAEMGSVLEFPHPPCEWGGGFLMFLKVGLTRRQHCPVPCW